MADVVISAQLVKQLREMTDAPMMDCKKALVETGGNIDKAVDFLREKGLSKASKKADRIASEGVINMKIAPDFGKASLLEINSETDFVAKNDSFIALVSKTTDVVFDKEIDTMQDLETISLDNTKFSEFFQQNIAKIGEYIVLRRFQTL